jgi:tRNA dimethylallyltransferase
MSGIDETSGKTEGGRIKNAILIAGPTASGKSRLALDMARRHDGVIVNADSMQVYDVLDVLTARPGAEDLKAAPHLLYGYVDPAVAHSTGAWLRDVAALVEQGSLAGRTPIFVGGTGLYFRGLTEGLSHMPAIPEAIRQRLRGRLDAEGPAELHRELARLDPPVAARLQASDGQRIVRALEVLEASGRSIAAWQASKGEPLVDAASARKLVIDIERNVLTQRIDDRLDQMVALGAVDEVRQLLARDLDRSLPAMRAIGVPEFAAAISGEISLEEAVSRAKIATRQYAKRQATWFRNQFDASWKRTHP